MEIPIQLSNVERREEIWRFIQKRQRATVSQICSQFSVSEATVRRDLDALADSKRIRRVHGGAISIRQAAPEPPALQRSAEQQAEKQRIAAAAAEMVKDGETIFLGSGTTVLEAARCLRSRHNLTVITNSLLVIDAMADLQDITIISLGGVLRNSERSFIGHLTEAALQELRPQKVIMGIRAISPLHGLTNEYIPEVSTDRVIIQSAPEIILLADHTKFGAVSTALVAPVNRVHKIITDSSTPLEMISNLRQAGIEVIVV